MTFREFDKKMLTFRPGLKYWKTVLENHKEWNKQVTQYDSSGLPVTDKITGKLVLVDKYTSDEIDELKLTDRIAVSTYVQGNGPETDTYTDKETANEIREALRDRFENINTMGLTELIARFYDVVKGKGNECPDE